MTNADESVLCVDLDGSLVATDLLAESTLLLVKQNPLYLIMLLVWLMRGRAHLKHEVARRVKLNAAALPYHASLLSWLREERRRGRRVAIATASDHVLASRVADHLGIRRRFGAIFEALQAVHRLRRQFELHPRGGAFAFFGHFAAKAAVMMMGSTHDQATCEGGLCNPR